MALVSGGLLFVSVAVLQRGVPVPLPQQWGNYVWPAAIILSMLSLVYAGEFKERVYLLVFVGQWLLIYVIGLPIGAWIGMELVLSVVVIGTFALICEPPTALVSVPAALVFMVGQQGELSAWNAVRPAVAGADVTLYVIVCGVVLGIAVFSRILVGRTQRLRVSLVANKEVIARLVAANMEYQRYALEVEKSSVQKERERISREIHDTVGYAFTNQRMVLEASRLLFDRDPQRLRRLLYQAHQTLTEGYQQIRQSLRALRRVGPADRSLDRRILSLTRQFSHVSGSLVTYEALGPRKEVPEELEQVLFRCVQEGITNAFCHGRARRVTITLGERWGELHLRVLDDGAGSVVVEEGLGITGMRERLRPFQGVVHYRSLQPGFVLEVTVPI